jgi:apolipoprotein D and lipocalin family protein
MTRVLVVFASAVFLQGCHSAPEMQPITPMPRVDLQRFMGDWYVIASIPTPIEKQAYNAIESYSLKEDGTIATTFTFNKGAFDGPAKRYQPKGFVHDGTQNAVWGMQFVWPVKAQYVIAYVDDAYGETIVARDKRDYVWIMARDPALAPAARDRLVTKVRELGYDTTLLRFVPQQTRESR